MGTSTNQASPRSSTSWMAARLVLGNQTVPVQRQTSELWRAAFRDDDARLQSELTSKFVAHCFRVAATADTPHVAKESLGHSAAQFKSSLVADLATRAVLRSVAQKGGAAQFAAELFVETVSYYAARDLPSFVGAPGRISTTSDAVRLKTAIRDTTRATAAKCAAAVGITGSTQSITQKDLATYVSQTARALTSTSERSDG